MSQIKKEITFEGLKYNLDDRDRVAVAGTGETFKTALNTLVTDGYISSGSTTTSGQMFFTSSAAVSRSFAGGVDGGADDTYLLLCVKK